MKLTLNTLLLLFIFTALTVVAEPARTCEKLRVGGSSRWFPIAYTAKDGQKIIGIGYDLIKLIAAKLALEVEINGQLPWKRALKYLKEGQLDVISALYWTEQRALDFHYSKAYFYNEPRIFVLKEKRFSYQKFEDLIGLSGIIPTGGSFGEAFDQFARENKLQLQGVSSKKLMVRALFNGMADYFIQDHLDGLSYLKQQRLEGSIIALPTPVSATPVHFALSKKSPCAAYLMKINLAISRAKAGGSLANIIRNTSNNSVIEDE